MTNWLADPVACAIRLKDESGCTILAGRNEILSRSTRCYRTDEPDGTYWRFGHLYARREETTKGVRITGGSHGPATEHHAVETSAMAPEHANALSDLLRAAYADSGSSACGGKTMLELFWDELMVVYERLVTGQEAEDDVGKAQGLAFCIAVASNPYLPDIDAVRAAAAKRWEEQEQEDAAYVAASPVTSRATNAQDTRRAARRARRAGK